ncbi:MAG: hypothetical protein ACQKBY_04800, partial [Verrucomicrobiales bacterium]
MAMKKGAAEDLYLSDPPRLLLGAGAIFWGGMTGNALSGLLMAMALEARHWVDLRWDFTGKAFVRAWQISLLIGLVAGFLMRFQFNPPLNLLEIFTWIPVFLLPVVLASLYSERAGIPLTTFSYFARRKVAQDRAEGVPVSESRVFLGFPFLGLLILMAGLGLRDLAWYAGGAGVLLFLAVYWARTGGRRRPAAWVAAASLSMALALAFASAISLLYYYLLDGGWYKEADRGTALESTTFLGRIGEIKLSPKIRWRLWVEEGAKPSLLRLSSYNVFGFNSWISAGEVPDRRRGDERTERPQATARDFTRLFSNSLTESGDFRRFAYAKENLPEVRDFSGRYRLRGAVKDEDLLPLDLEVRAIDEMAAFGLEYNVMGATRVVEPGYLVTDFVVERGEGAESDEDPYLSDLQVSRRRGEEMRRHERRGFREELRRSLERFWEELGESVREEADEPPREVDEAEERRLIALMAQTFQRDYRYTLNERPRRQQDSSMV